MPLIERISLSDKTTIGIWQIQEEPEELAILGKPEPRSLLECFSWGSKIRQQQWLAVRAVYMGLTGRHGSEIQYNTFGKPFLKDPGTHISITHSGPYALIVLSYDGPCGIDAETFHPRIRKIANHFLNDQELVYSGEGDSLLALYYYWCSKEAVYKIHGQPSPDFRNDIHIHSIDYLCRKKGTGTATVRIGGELKQYRLFPVINKALIIVLACQ
jgi:phosphopantetheinyl transferase